MAAQILFDQVGIPAGTPGEARSDGLSNGATVTVTNASGQPCRCEFWWIPPDDSAAVLVQNSAIQWEFTPQANRHGEYIVRMIEAEGTDQETEDIKAFGIRLPVSGLLVPGLNSRGDFDINLASSSGDKTTAALISFQNEPLPDNPAINYANWWQSQRELYEQVEALSALPTGIVHSVVWDPDIVVDTPYRYRLLDDCVAALPDGYGIIYMAGDAVAAFTITGTGVIDFENRIALCSTAGGQTITLDDTAQIQWPWFIDGDVGGAGNEPLSVVRSNNNADTPCIVAGKLSMWIRALQFTRTTGTPGDAPTLRYQNETPGTFNLMLEDCRFIQSECITGISRDLDLRLRGERTVISSSNLIGGFLDAELSVDEEIEWDESFFGAALGGTPSYLKAAARYPSNTSMLEVLLNDGTTVVSAVEHRSTGDQLYFNDVPLTATGGGTNFLADDGTYKTVIAAGYLPLSGGTMTGAINMNGNNLTNAALISTGSIPSTDGAIRLSFANDIVMRNSANSGNVPLLNVWADGRVIIGPATSLGGTTDRVEWASPFEHWWSTVGTDRVSLAAAYFAPVAAQAGLIELGQEGREWEAVHSFLYIFKRGFVTIAGGQITATHSYMLVSNEGAAPNDDLTTITAGISGQRLLIQQASSAQDIRILTTGNITIPGSASYLQMTSSDQFIELEYHPTYGGSGRWMVISISPGVQHDATIYVGGVDVGGGSIANVNLVDGVDVSALYAAASFTDGTRAFTGVVGGVTPTADAHLTTKLYVDTAVSGGVITDHGALNNLTNDDHVYYPIEWQDAVISVLATPPGSPSPGDRYEVGEAATGVWLGQDGNIAEWSGSSWNFITVGSNTVRWNTATTRYVLGVGDRLENRLDHGNMGGLNGDDHTQYLRADGSRALTGDWNVGGFDITNIGFIDVGSSSKSWSPNAATIAVFERNTETAISVVSGASSVAAINLGDVNDEDVCRLHYDNTLDILTIKTGADWRVALSSTFLRPYYNDQILSGDSTHRWAEVWSVDHNYSGNRVTPWTAANVTSTSFTLGAPASEAIRLSGTVTEAQVHNITAGSDGQHLVLSLDSSASFGVTIRDNVGSGANNIRLKASDVSLDAAWKKLCLIYNSDASAWCEV